MLAACDRVLGLSSITAVGDGGGRVDASPDGVPCASVATPHDNFSSVTACSPWGMQTGDPSITRQGQGMFVVTPQPSIPAQSGGCTTISPVALPPGGTFIEVSSALSMTGACFMWFRARSQDASIGGQLILQYGKLGISDPMAGTNGIQVAYDPVAMRWWRIRPVADGIVGEVSPDGNAWHVFGTIPGMPTAMVTIDFEATCGVGDPAPGTAVFQSFDVCP